MLRAVSGIYRHGEIELLERPKDIKEADVIITFLPQKSGLRLSDFGISKGQAENLRAQLGSFTEDWDDPEMDVYDAIYAV